MSISAQDLRIGNWIKLGKEFQQVYQIIYELGKGHSINHIDYKEDWFEPIPLSPEVLQAAGFEPMPHFTVQNIYDKKLERGRVLSIACVGTPNEMIFLNEEDPPKVKNVVVVRNYDYDGKIYLHQLQNLFYSLTGEELTIDINALEVHYL